MFLQIKEIVLHLAHEASIVVVILLIIKREKIIMKNLLRIIQGACLVTLLIALPACWPCSCTKESTEQQAKKSDLVVINVLDKELYEDCHIKGSVNVALDQLEQFAAGLDKENAEIVVYCSNYQCSASETAAKKLQELGCKHVAVYEGGMAEWHQQNRAHEGACTPEKSAYLATKVERPQVEHKDITVIDADTLEQKINQVVA